MKRCIAVSCGAAAVTAVAVAAAVIAAPAGAITPHPSVSIEQGVVPPGPVTGTVVKPPQAPPRPNPTPGIKECSQAALAFAVSPDKQVFTLTYGDFVVDLAAKGTLNRVETSCNASVMIDIPAGYQFALAKIDSRGYANLTKGARAALKTKVAVNRSPYVSTPNDILSGPLDKDFTFTNNVPTSADTWSSCGGSNRVAIDSVVEVTRAAAPASGQIHMDSTDVSTGTALDILWRKCSK